MQAIIKSFGALAQEHRLGAYRLLVQAGEAGLSAGEIARALDIAASSLSFHLAQLANAGLVTSRRSGRTVIYAPDYRAMDGLIRFLTETATTKGPGTGAERTEAMEFTAG